MCRCSMMQYALGHTFQKTLPPTFPAHDDRMTKAMQQEVPPFLCFHLVGVSHLILFPKRLYKLRKGTIVQWFLSISLIQLCNTNGPPLSSRIDDTTFTFSWCPQVCVSHLVCPLEDCPVRMGSILFTFNIQLSATLACQPWPISFSADKRTWPKKGFTLRRSCQVGLSQLYYLVECPQRGVMQGRVPQQGPNGFQVFYSPLYPT